MATRSLFEKWIGSASSCWWDVYTIKKHLVAKRDGISPSCSTRYLTPSLRSLVSHCIELNTRREIPYLRAHKYYSLCIWTAKWNEVWSVWSRSFLFYLNATYVVKRTTRTIQRPAPSWPDTSTARALHRHHRGQGSWQRVLFLKSESSRLLLVGK